jgi:hypothetical protein
MRTGTEFLHVCGAVALALGFLLLCLRPALANRLAAAQAVAVGLGAAAMAIAGMSLFLAAAALILLVGNGGLGARFLPDGPVAPARPARALIGAGLLALGILVLPQEAGVPREGLALGVGTALLGAVAAVSGPLAGAGLLAVANGTALAALALGDPPTALAATLLGAGMAALGGLVIRGAETAS